MRLHESLLGEFQFTLPRGERLSSTRYARIRSVSIHAPARGATAIRLALIGHLTCFNSRSREGSDEDSHKTLPTVSAFQFTLPRGERHICTTKFPTFRRFNSRSREGSDEGRLVIVAELYKFQFTLPRGERRVKIPRTRTSQTFQFTLPRGERQAT